MINDFGGSHSFDYDRVPTHQGKTWKMALKISCREKSGNLTKTDKPGKNQGIYFVDSCGNPAMIRLANTPYGVWKLTASCALPTT